MDREFLELYNRELTLLYEQAQIFSEEFPEIAQRLGGLTRERGDPTATGLLEGAAYLAARVQLKMVHEFPEFTGNLLERLLPDALAPTPSAALVSFVPPYGDAALRDGRQVQAGEVLEAVSVVRDSKVACRFTLSGAVTLWPFDVPAAAYLTAPAQLQALGIPASIRASAGLVLNLRHRSVPRASDEPQGHGPTEATTHFAGCRIDRLPVHLLGAESDAVALCEQIFGRRVSLHLRYLDSFGNPLVLAAPGVGIEPIGFGDDGPLLPRDDRAFVGFEALREYLILPRKFVGFALTGLQSVLDRLPTSAVDVIISFSEMNPRLASYVQPPVFGLYVAPAVNLFEMTTDRMPVRPGLHEYHVVPDRSRPLDYEPHRILSVYAHRRGGKGKVEVAPLYRTSLDQGADNEDRLAYTIRRLPRRRTSEERRHGTASDYVGTEMFLTVTAPSAGLEADDVMELSARVLCSNRHLPELLPVGQGAADFRLLSDTELLVKCVVGPTKPRVPVTSERRGRTAVWSTGSTVWRLLNLLALNHLGFSNPTAAADARMLREAIMIFADVSDGVIERRLAGLRSIVSQNVVRRVRRPEGVAIARGIEIRVTLEEKAFEGTGIFLLGAVLDHFFASYVHVNTFTETVLVSTERGEIMRWPARIGGRPPL